MLMGKIFVGIAIVALIGVGGYFLAQKNKAQAAVQQEVALQQSEKQECEKRLTLFYGAWKKYKADHKGQDPATVDLLVPKYISDVNLLVCPTAKRWISNHKAIDRGTFKVNNKDVDATYEFLWLGANKDLNLKKYGDKAPLIACSAHEEGLYLAVYNKKPPVSAFDADKRAGYVAELQNAHLLAVRRNGTVGELTSNEE